MDLSRLRTGEWIAGISGVALFVVMFLPWFGVDATVNAWEAFDFIDVVLMLAVISGVGMAALAVAQSNVQLPVAASAITAGIGIVGALVVLYRIVDPVGDADRKIGLYLGLIAAVAVAAGGWLAMQEEGTTFGSEVDRMAGP